MVKTRDDRERRRAGSTQRDAKHRVGGDWTTLIIPDGIDIFQPKEGTVQFDIVPFVVGEGNPYAKPGELYYERTYFTHPRIGPNNESYVCPAKTAGKPCPICEYRAQLAKDPDGDEALVKSLKPKERQLFLIHLAGKSEEGNKVKLYETSFHIFGKLLDRKRQDAEEDEPHITDFDDPKAGATLKVSYNEEDAGGYSFLDCYSIEFKPRIDGLDQEILNHGICLDDVVKVLPYDVLKKVFLQEGETEDEDSPIQSPAKSAVKDRQKPVETAKKSPSEEEEDDWDDDEPAPKAKAKPQPVAREEESDYEEGQQVRHRQFGICEIVRIGDDGLLLLKNDEGKKFKGVDPKNIRPLAGKPIAKPKTISEEDDDDDEPAPKAKPKIKPVPEKEEDDWDDDDEPAPKAKAKSSTAKSKKEDDDDWD